MLNEGGSLPKSSIAEVGGVCVPARRVGVLRADVVLGKGRRTQWSKRRGGGMSLIKMLGTVARPRWGASGRARLLRACEWRY